MKKMKRLFSFLLVLVMLVAMTITGFAADSTDSGVKVMLNGEYVSFTDAVPQVVNGRTMVPYKAIFEALGAEVSWDQETTTVTAIMDELSMSFKIGQPELTITDKDGNMTHKQMDVVPFVDSKTYRTMVSVRFISESMGYGVGWDNDNKTAVIIDWDKLTAELGDIDKDFSILSKMENSSKEDMNKTYHSTGSLDMKGTAEPAMLTNMGVSGADKAATVHVSGNIDAFSKGLDMDMKMNLKCDFSDILALASSDEEKASLEELNATLGNLEMLMKMNGETGESYIQSDAMLKGMELEKGTWISMNVFDIYEQMGIDLKDIMQNIASGQDLNPVKMILNSVSATEDYTIDTYSNVKKVYAVCKALLGDGAFKTKTSGNTTVYTNELTAEKRLAAIAAAGENIGSKSDLGAIKESLDILLNVSGKIEFTVKNNVLADMNMSFSYAEDGMTVSIVATGNDRDAKTVFDLSKKDEFSLNMTMEMSSVETTETVNTKIPAGAKVVTMEELTAPAVA